MKEENPPKTGIIYRARSRTDRKIYIGQTTRSLRVRKGEHWKLVREGSEFPFHQALRKYGKGGFGWKVIDQAQAQTSELLKEALDTAERVYIKQHDSANPKKGYNRTHGGTFEFEHVEDDGRPRWKIPRRRKCPKCEKFLLNSGYCPSCKSKTSSALWKKKPKKKKPKKKAVVGKEEQKEPNESRAMVIPRLRVLPLPDVSPRSAKPHGWRPWHDDVISMRLYSHLSVKTIAGVVDLSASTIEGFLSSPRYKTRMEEIQKRRRDEIEKEGVISQARVYKLIEASFARVERAVMDEDDLQAAVIALRGLGYFNPGQKIDVNLGARFEQWMQAFERV